MASDKQLPQLVPAPPQFLSLGHTPEEWETVTKQLYPAATDANVVVLAATICKAQNLPLLKKPLHIVPMYDAKTRTMKDTIWPGIALYEIEAHRTGQFAGTDPVEYGPMVELEIGFAGEVYDNNGSKRKIDNRTKVMVPEWACATVYRLVDGVRCAFTSDRLYFSEWCQTVKSGDRKGLLTDVWQKKMRFMLGKCARAAALRVAFPEQTGSIATAEEMEGGEINADYVDATAYVAQPGDDAIAKRAGTSGRVRAKAQQPATDQQPVAGSGNAAGQQQATQQPASSAAPAGELATPAEKKAAMERWKANSWTSGDVLKVLTRQFPDLAKHPVAQMAQYLTKDQIAWFEKHVGPHWNPESFAYATNDGSWPPFGPPQSAPQQDDIEDAQEIGNGEEK